MVHREYKKAQHKKITLTRNERAIQDIRVSEAATRTTNDQDDNSVQKWGQPFWRKEMYCSATFENPEGTLEIGHVDFETDIWTCEEVVFG